MACDADYPDVLCADFSVMAAGNYCSPVLDLPK